MAVVRTERPIITLTTDFGWQDNYVALMKAVMAGINPAATTIDITHDIPSFGIKAAAYVLESSCRYFPSGSIHLAVVDPGVGTERRPLLIETLNHFFVGPDNGLFAFLDRTEIVGIYQLNRKKYHLKVVSRTFHGRDIFAPAAAYLSRGVIPQELGSAIRHLSQTESFLVKKIGNKVIGELIYIDKFGNMVSSIRESDLPLRPFVIYLNRTRIGALCGTFGDVAVGKPLAYINSAGFLEIGVRENSAAEKFGIEYEKGAKILIAPE